MVSLMMRIAFEYTSVRYIVQGCRWWSGPHDALLQRDLDGDGTVTLKTSNSPSFFWFVFKTCDLSLYWCVSV